MVASQVPWTIKKFFLSCLRGASQVIFSANPLSGFIFLVAIFFGSKLSVSIGAIVGLTVSTLTSRILRNDEAEVEKGLFGYNGILIGIAIPVFFDASWPIWMLLIALAIFAPPTTVLLNRVLRPLSLPALTLPFVLLTWAGIAFGHKFLQHSNAVASASMTLDLKSGISGALAGFSQIFLVDNPVSGGLILLALAFSSKRFAIWGVVAAALSFALWVFADFNRDLIFSGVYGYNSILVGIAAGAVFLNPGLKTCIVSVFGILLAAVIQNLFIEILGALDLPSLTAPFVFGTWICLWVDRRLGP